MITEPRWKSYIVETTKPIFTPKQCQMIINAGRAEPKQDAYVGNKKDLKKEIALVELEADLIKEANEELVKEKKKLNSGKDALEGVARTELGLIKPGEKFYVFKEQVQDDNSTDK